MYERMEKSLKLWQESEQAKVAGRLSVRVMLALRRSYDQAHLEKPLEQVTDEEFLSLRNIGPKSLLEIRLVIPGPIDKRLLLCTVFGEEGHHIPDEVVMKVLSTLDDPRERFVIEHRFTTRPMTLEQVAKGYPRKDGGFGVTRERVRQKEAIALRRLRRDFRRV